MRGKSSYRTRVTDTALGTIRSLEATVQGFEERAARLEGDIKDSKKRAGELETKVGATFEKEDRYHYLVKRQAEIEDKLDLAKNQAPAQAAEISHETNVETVSIQSPNDIAKSKHERAKRAGVRI